MAVGLCGSAAAGAQAAEFAGTHVVAMRRLPASVVGGVSAVRGAGDSSLRPLLSPAVAEAATPPIFFPSSLPPLLSVKERGVCLCRRPSPSIPSPRQGFFSIALLLTPSTPLSALVV